MGAIFKRELKAYFSTPIGYIFLAAFYFFLGLFFYIVYTAGSPEVGVVLLSMSTISVFAILILFVFFINATLHPPCNPLSCRIFI